MTRHKPPSENRARAAAQVLAWGAVAAFNAPLWAEPPALPALQQIIRHFDFEEQDAAPNSLPVPFYRHIAASQGFPPFGAMRLTTAIACTGRGALEFELGGGSLSARIPTSIVPILPLTDYAVSVKVRTDGLQHAKARLVAWLHDKAGQPIHSSRVQSRLIESAGQWDTLSVEVRGDDAEAADLVLELQVLQPGQFQTASVGNLEIDVDQTREPRLEDISGRAWFDDVIVSHLPHVRLTMSQPGNLVSPPQSPELLIHVNELTSESLTAQVQIFDLDGEIVHEATFPAPRGRQGGTMRVPITKCGWYRALLHVRSQNGVTRRQWLDFAILPETVRRARLPNHFGVVLNRQDASVHDQIPDLVSALGCGAAVVPIWARENAEKKGEERGHQRQALHRMIERLLARDVELIFSLDIVPEELARSAGVDARQVVNLLAMGSQHWQPYLDELLVNFGLEVNRWQIGAIEDADQIRKDHIRPTFNAAQQSLAAFVPKPVLYATWSVEHDIAADDRLAAYAVAIPSAVRPESIERYAAPYLSGPEVFALVDELPRNQYSARQRVSDLMIRGLYSWRAKFPLINIAAPWGVNDSDASAPAAMPDPAFCIWRTLSEHLNGRTFVAELVLAEGMHCWLLRGASAADSALVAWSNGAQTFQQQLAGGPVTIIDAFGNRTSNEPVQGVHSIPLHDLPVFIEQVNLSLVQFRGGVRIEPAFVPAIAKAHEFQIVIRNPWDINVAGSIRLTEEDEWQLVPNVQEFTIQAGGEAHLPLNIVPQRSILAGAKRLAARIALTADQSYTMDLELELEVGLKNIDLAPTWTIARNAITGENDLIISQAVTNHGDSPVNLDVFLLADGVSQTRRTIASLGRGETAVRTFRIPNGEKLLAGQQVRVGVAERDGLTRLNQLLAIPEIAASRAAAE